MRLRSRIRKQAKTLLARAGIEVRRVGQQRNTATADMPHLLAQVARDGLVPTTILDVGGHQGTWSRMAQRVFPGARSVLVEPQSEHEAALQRFCFEFAGSRYYLAAAGAKPGELTINLWDDLAGTSALAPTSGSGSGKQRVVPMIAIDDRIASGDFEPPELVKIDVQGFELEVLAGAQTLFGVTEAFVVETSLYEFMPGMPLFHDIVAYFAARGYVAYDFPGFLRRPSDGALGQCDVCFVKRDGRFRRSTQW